MAGAATQEEPAAPDDAFDDYRRERFLQAREAGLSLPQARRFANGQVPLRVLVKLRRDGCSPATLARIVC